MSLVAKVAVLEELHRNALELATGLAFSDELHPLALDVDRIEKAISAELTRAQAALAEVERERQEAREGTKA